MGGWLLFDVLTMLAVADAIGVAMLVTSARVERFVVGTAVFFGLIAAPSLALGYLEVLYPASLAIVSAIVFAAVAFAVTRKISPREVLFAAREIAMLPLEGLRECVRARSVVVVPLAWAFALGVYAFFEAWRVPNVDWDALIYHEPIVGFALQNHGFAMVHLPPNASIQAVNAYPKLCEMTSLWFVAFTDRTLMELPNVISYPALAAAGYLVFRRFCDRVPAMGLAAVLAFMPQIWSQLCMMAIDVEVAFFAVFGLHMATREGMRVRDVACAFLAAALLVASKGSGLAIAASITCVAIVRAFVALPGERRRLAIVSSACALGVVGIGVVPYVRDWRAFGNPLWPVTFRAFGHDFAGLLTLREIVVDQPLSATFGSFFELPGEGLVDIVKHGFGFAIPWIIFPIAILALPIAAFRRFEGARGLVWIVVLGVAFTLTTPTLGRNSRYNIHILVCVMALAAWVIGRAPRVARELVFALCAFLSVVPLFKLNGWLWSYNAAKDTTFLAHPFGSRSQIDNPRFELLASARDAELGKGDVAAEDWSTLFIGELWTFDFSNRVEVVECNGDTCLSGFDAVNAKWAAATAGATQHALDESPLWERVGRMTSEDGAIVYRRKR